MYHTHQGNDEANGKVTDDVETLGLGRGNGIDGLLGRLGQRLEIGVALGAARADRLEKEGQILFKLAQIVLVCTQVVVVRQHVQGIRQAVLGQQRSPVFWSGSGVCGGYAGSVRVNNEW